MTNELLVGDDGVTGLYRRRCMLPDCGWTVARTRAVFRDAEWRQHYAAHMRRDAELDALHSETPTNQTRERGSRNDA